MISQATIAMVEESMRQLAREFEAAGCSQAFTVSAFKGAMEGAKMEWCLAGGGWRASLAQAVERLDGVEAMLEEADRMETEAKRIREEAAAKVVALGKA